MSIRFERLTIDLIEWARELHNDPEVIKNLTDPHLVTPDEQLKWFIRLQDSTSSERLVVQRYGFKSYPIGLVRVDHIDDYNKSVCIGLDIHKDFRGQGLAKEIYHRLFEKYFSAGYNRIWLMVADYNERAKHIYESLGFQYEGKQREALFKDGKYFDYLIMSILKKEHEALNDNSAI